ncbi:hypothetical protein ACSTS3_08225 [Aquimarina muelleri]|uniref:hypothetical protein n=1 Tax=Aquimarina muelleri TaxID=279356 RepID=UPI003F6857D1
MNVKINVMNIESTKLELMHLLLQTQKESLLAKLKKVFEEEQTDWWYDLSEQEQKDIEIGLSQADNKDYIDDHEAMKRFKKWN